VAVPVAEDAPSRRTRATLQVMAWTLLGKLAGIVWRSLVSALLGATRLSDAYSAIQILPQAIISIETQAFSTVTVPFFHESPEEAPRLLSALGRVVLLSIAPLALLLGFLAPLYLPRLYHIGPSGVHAVSLVVWFVAAMIVPLALAAVWTGRLNALRRFGPLSAANLARSGSTLALIFLLRGYGLLGIGIGLLGGTLLQLLFMVPATAPFAQPRPETWQRTFRMLRLLPSQVTSSVVGQVNFFVDQFFASSLAAGSLFELQNAGQFLELPVTLIGQSLATVLFPDFAEHAKARDPAGLVGAVDRALYLTWVATLPIAALLIGMSRPVVDVVFHHGHYGRDAVIATAAIVAAYAVSLVFRTMQQFLLRAFYSYKNTRILGRLSLLAMLANAGLDYGLMLLMGTPGIALSTTIVSGLYFLSSLFYLQRLLGTRGISPAPYLRALLIALPLAPLGYVLSRGSWLHGWLMQLGLVVAIGSVLLGLYLLLLWSLGGERGRSAIRVVRGALPLGRA